MKRVHIEYLVASGIALVLLVLLGTAGLRARAAVRDDLRRTDTANLKHAAEMYYNEHSFYPAPIGGTGVERGIPPLCTSSDQDDSWLFGNSSPFLEEGDLNAVPHDVREKQGHLYIYCATDVQNNHTLSYYIQAQLEVRQPDQVAFDDDETRKFDYRILNEDGRILYRVCGGTETQCTPAAP